MRTLATILVLAVGLLAESVSADSKSVGTYRSGTHWTMDLMTGSAINAVTPLDIEQTGLPDISTNAQYETKPFDGSYFYLIRFGYWPTKNGWTIELFHHKLYLKNNPPGVQTFTITDGYNMVMLRRVWNFFGIDVSLAAGAVVTHPESRIRGQSFSEDGGLFSSGYHISGPVVGVGFGYKLYLTSWLSLNAEGGVNASYFDVPIADGKAYGANYHLYAVAGIGICI